MEATTLTLPNISLPKRTRLNVRQSKDGCIVCKARKVKCDESKPTCLRCHRAGKVCEGYGLRDRGQCRNPESSPSSTVPPEPDGLAVSRSSSGLSSFCYSSLEANQSRLGLEILIQQRREQTEWDEQPLWVRLVAQSLPANEAISRAVISLGASFEAHISPSFSVPRYQASVQNQQAIKALRKELASPSQGLVPVFLACIVLAAAEVLERHPANALIHLRGAFQALTLAGVNKFGDMHSFAQSLDLQAAWYVLSDPPRLPPSVEPWEGVQLNSDAATIEASTISLLHNCYHFTSRAGKFKYRLRGDQPAALILEQNRYIAALTGWLATYNEMSTGSKRSLVKCSVLRAQCLSTLIYVSTILCPHEITYDLYSAHFQKIVQLSEGIVALSGNAQSSPLQHFKIQPDLFQALYLTAMKCRDSQLRRRAVQLFSPSWC